MYINCSLDKSYDSYDVIAHIPDIFYQKGEKAGTLKIAAHDKRLNEFAEKRKSRILYSISENGHEAFPIKFKCLKDAAEMLSYLNGGIKTETVEKILNFTNEYKKRSGSTRVENRR